MGIFPLDDPIGDGVNRMLPVSLGHSAIIKMDDPTGIATDPINNNMLATAPGRKAQPVCFPCG
jgi:hypothetical protein